MQAHSFHPLPTPGRPGQARLDLASLITTRLLILGLAWPAWGWAAALKDVEFVSLPGNQVRIDLVLSAPVAAPRDFATEVPARISLDLPGVASELPRKQVEIGVSPVQSLTALDDGNRTRVVVNLDYPVPYRIQGAGDRVTIAINEPQTETAPPTIMAPQAEPATPAGPDLRDVDFQRGPGGEGRVLVKLPTPDTRAIVTEKGQRIMVEVINATLPEHLRRRLDVVDSGTPVVAIESRPQGRDIEIAIATNQGHEYLAYQVNELLTIEFRALAPKQKQRHRRDKEVFSGDRLTLNFQDIEVRAVLQLLADFTGMNLVASDSVGGNITLRLKKVPWDQALDIILKAKGLTMRQQGNIIMIGPTEEVLAREEKELEATRKIKELAPLHTEYIQINYAKAGDVAKTLEGQLAAARGGKGQGGLKGQEGQEAQVQPRGLLSSRGSVTSDERTNTLLVQDTADKLEEIRQLVARLDISVRQVMIESRVVIASDNFARELGVRFGYNRLQINENKGDFNEIYGGRPGTLTSEDYWGTLVDDTIPLMVDLPAPNATSAVNFLIGKIGSRLLQLELSAMEKEGRGEIVSNPRIITSDKQSATIEVGKKIPVVTPGTQDNPPTVEYQDASLKLEVTPHITPDNRIIMGLKVSKDEADRSFEVQGNPVINQRKIETNVLVDNGETVVLGGVYERTRTSQKERVPWLGSLPVVGNLFKNNARLETNEELLIFVTPRILQQEMNTR
jgi:type IV pilus assembly protein PilQ